MDFRWTEWNWEHVQKHGVDPEDAEAVVAGSRSPFPRRVGDDKWIVWGRSDNGRLLQVVFVVDQDDTVFIIHARPLSEREKRRYRRMTRGT